MSAKPKIVIEDEGSQANNVEQSMSESTSSGDSTPPSSLQQLLNLTDLEQATRPGKLDPNDVGLQLSGGSQEELIDSNAIFEGDTKQPLTIGYANSSVNMKFWYYEHHIQKIIELGLKTILSASNKPRLDMKHFVKNDITYIVGYDLAINDTGINVSKLNLVDELLQEIVTLDVVNTNKIEIILPVNVNGSHWILCCIQAGLLFGSENKVLAPTIKLITYDSLPHIYTENEEKLVTAQYANSLSNGLQGTLQKYIPETFMDSFTIKIQAHSIKRQPDIYACGVLVANAVLQLGQGKELENSFEFHSVDEIIELRQSHIDLLGPDFDQEQKINQAVTLNNITFTLNPEKICEIVQSLFGLVSNNCKFFELAREFNRCEAQQQTLYSQMEMAQQPGSAPDALEQCLASMEKISSESTEANEKIKAWFFDEYITLADIPLFFFNPKQNTDTELSWKTNGTDTRDTFVNVIARVFALLTITKKTKEMEQYSQLQKEEYTKHPLDALDMREFAKAKDKLYSYYGTINTSNSPEGLALESWESDTKQDELTNLSIFSGGEPAQLGMSIYTHKYEDEDRDEDLYFAGTRDAKGKPLKGPIKCIIGPPFYEKHVVYTGQVRMGLLDGAGTISYFGETEEEFRIYVFMDDVECRVVSSADFAEEYLDSVLEHFDTYFYDNNNWYLSPEKILREMEMQRQQTFTAYANRRHRNRLTSVLAASENNGSAGAEQVAKRPKMTDVRREERDARVRALCNTIGAFPSFEQHKTKDIMGGELVTGFPADDNRCRDGLEDRQKSPPDEEQTRQDCSRKLF